MRTSPQWQPANQWQPGYRYRRPRWRRPLIVLTLVAVLVALIAYGGLSVYQRLIVPALALPGCQAGSGQNAEPLDFDQAADAATIAGVAARERLSTRALTIAYATALQESKLENLTSGDRDSVGIFQQRPSEGWGTAKQIQDPVYATTAFFGALVKVSHYQTIPVYQAAQAVQHSADGSAYQGHVTDGQLLAADYTSAPHAVTCWYSPDAQAAAQDVSPKLNLTGAATELDHVFGTPGTPGEASALTGVTRLRSGPGGGEADAIRATPGNGWTVADWLVANASLYGITQVRYAGYLWKASPTETSWQQDAAATTSDIVAS